MSRAATEPSNGFLVAPIRECSTRERSSLSAASALSTCATAKYRAASISTIRVQSCARSECCQLLQPTLSDAESNECCALGENLDSGARKFEPKGTRGAQGNPKPQRRILMTPKPTTAERDSAQLEALGHDSKFDRSMSLWANFALGFTYLSPVVGVYTVFAFAIATGGPPMFWSYLFVGLGQLLVALVFGEIVSQFPIAGGLYPWARRLVGKRWAWMAGWVYLWALWTTIAAVGVGGGSCFGQVFGIRGGRGGGGVAVGVVVVLSALLTVGGAQFLAWVARVGVVVA